MAEPASPNPKKLLGQLRDAISIKHYAYATQETYVHWAKRTILFHNKRHPAEMGVPEIEAVFYTWPRKAMSTFHPRTRLSVPFFSSFVMY